MAERLFKDALKNAFGKIIGGELPGDFRTDAEVADAFAEHYEKDVVLEVDVNDGEESIATPTIVITDSNGDAVDAELDGTYIVHKGQYSFSVEKAGYAVVTGVFEVDFADVEALAKTVVIPMSLLTFTVTYNLNGGSVQGSERDVVAFEVPYGTLVGSAQPSFTPTYEAHTWTTPFWVTTAEGDVDAAALPVVADVTVYAYWVLT